MARALCAIRWPGVVKRARSPFQKSSVRTPALAAQPESRTLSRSAERGYTAGKKTFKVIS